MSAVFVGEVVTAPCDMCGELQPILYRDSGPNRFCVHCAEETSHYNDAYEQLEVIMRQAVSQWVAEWGTLPVMLDFSQQCLMLGRKFQEEYLRNGDVG